MLTRDLIARLALPLFALVLIGCGQGRDVTPTSVAAARKLWNSANVRDYNVEWMSSGAQNGHYVVYVRDGIVRAIDQMILDPKDGSLRTIRAKPGNMSYYGIEGLFKIIEEECLQLGEDHTSGQPARAPSVQKFVPDPKLGYPTKYRRDVVGSTQGLAIDVIRFEPNPPAKIPPPST